jgi:molybdopterin converting factor small subunit
VPLIDALKELAELYEEQFARILFDEDGALRPSVMVLVNDAPVNREALPNLNAGDRVALLPAIAGG